MTATPRMPPMPWRWTREAGWHGYIPPSQELIKARMITRRKETRS